ncbi:MAG: hypothetical protein MUO40_12055 [Anaerolineaceae bacterium]|nr:hypothetical protein [Anaerolineaceae bacterium]
MNKRKIIAVIVILVLSILACGVPQKSSSSDGQADIQPNEEPSIGLFPNQDSSTDQDPDSTPVSLNKGLSTLNSFKMTIEVEMIGPSQQDITRVKSQQEYSSAQDAVILMVETYSMNLEDDEPSTNKTYSYRFGNERCTWAGDPDDDYEYDSMEPDQKEMADLVLDLFDMNFLIENPIFVGEESLNSIQTNHFTFQLSGLGVESGATVINNQGEYWLAVDGNYIVRYSLFVETSSSPEKINHLLIVANLEEINQTMNLSMPQGCYDAKSTQ